MIDRDAAGRGDGHRRLGSVEPSLTCLACDHRYGYVGVDPRPGRCPACGSPAVPLAPPFETTAVEVVRSPGVDPDRPAAEVVGRDATGRTVRYYLHHAEEASGLVPSIVEIDDHLVDVGDRWPEELVLPAVVRAVEDAGFRFVGRDGRRRDEAR
jgi:hypothetical protein